MTDQLTQLQKFTVIVADTGDIDAIKKYTPQDATTNPSLLLAAANNDGYKHLIEDAVKYGEKYPGDEMRITMDKLFVNAGTEILKYVPGLISTETDARLSFDTEALLDQAHRMIDFYKENGIDKSRVLIKLASTWEGIKAAEALEKEGIHVNMTLIFAKCQGVACSQFGATLISPFVGRILDWYKAKTGKTYSASEDPGVLSVKEIYEYYKETGSKTVVMGASFRSRAEVLELAGCDKLTIGPKFLEELKASTDPVERKLKSTDKVDPSKAVHLTEAQFRFQLNEDAMATEQLADGIRKFAADAIKLEGILESKFGVKNRKKTDPQAANDKTKAAV